MSLEEIQNKAIETYNNNLSFLKQKHLNIYNKIELYNNAIESNIIKENFNLEYDNNYFDLINTTTKQPYYGSDSIKISNKMVKDQLTPSFKENSFKTFYEIYPNEEIQKKTINSNVLTNYINEISPFVYFVNSKVPKIQEFNNLLKYIILGTGLGFHIPKIHEKIKSHCYLIVEPSLEVFRLSLFTTDYTKIATESKVIFSVAEDESEFKKTFELFIGEAFVYNHYLKLFKLSDETNFYTERIQRFLVSQEHLTYSFDRIFLSLYRTHKCIKNKYKILHLQKMNLIEYSKKPMIVLGAGPSLQKNIDFLKENQDKFIIIAIYATLPILEQHNIKPDIITQYDSQKDIVLSTLNNIQNIDFFKDAIFLFASHLDNKLYKTFGNFNMYIFQALYELKKGFGVLTSPSIGEMTYALSLFLSSKDIYLLGLDLAMDKVTRKTHVDGHAGSNAYQNLKDFDESKLQDFDLKNNTIKIKGNFDKEVYSTAVFKMSVDIFNFFTKNYKNSAHLVYNLSDGAYFEDSIPLKIKNIKLDDFTSMNKKEFLKESISYFNSISEEGYNNIDFQVQKNKIHNIKKLEKILKEFYNNKSYRNENHYKDTLYDLFDKLLINNTQDKDLEKLLQNYALNVVHYVFYIFNVKGVIKDQNLYKELSKIIYTQFNKVIDTYSISLRLEDKNYV